MDINCYSYSCALCSYLSEETAQHLFLNYDFARMCWNLVGVDIPLQSNIEELIPLIKAQINSQFFMETIILLCWTIWNARNELIFRGNGSNSLDCARFFFKELRLIRHRLKQDLHQALGSWIQSLELIAA